MRRSSAASRSISARLTSTMRLENESSSVSRACSAMRTCDSSARALERAADLAAQLVRRARAAAILKSIGLSWLRLVMAGAPRRGFASGVKPAATRTVPYALGREPGLMRVDTRSAALPLACGMPATNAPRHSLDARGGRDVLGHGRHHEAAGGDLSGDAGDVPARRRIAAVPARRHCDVRQAGAT